GPRGASAAHCRGRSTEKPEARRRAGAAPRPSPEASLTWDRDRLTYPNPGMLGGRVLCCGSEEAVSARGWPPGWPKDLVLPQTERSGLGANLIFAFRGTHVTLMGRAGVTFTDRAGMSQLRRTNEGP